MPLHSEVTIYNTDSQPQLMSGSTDIEIIESGPPWQGVQLVHMWMNYGGTIDDGGTIEYASVLLKDNKFIRPHDTRGNHILQKVFGCPIHGIVELCDMGNWIHVTEELASTHKARLRNLEAETHTL